jgi:hypothetical protein
MKIKKNLIFILNVLYLKKIKEKTNRGCCIKTLCEVFFIF